ncbi:MAG: adenylate kinase [Pseudobdellovibrionaceae bacterium]
MNLALFGPPGCGKGTQAKLLVERLQFFQISTGDLLRDALKNGTNVGLEAKKFIDAGQLVPDHVVLELVTESVGKIKKGFILDGYPRNLNQAKQLDEVLKDQKISLKKNIFIEVPRDLLVGRISGRRVCRSCGAIYHIDSKPSKKDCVCDLCGGETYQRSDDRAELVSERLKVYDNSTAPLIEFYKTNKTFYAVDGNKSLETVYGDICKIIYL